jgi:hypothetical protein
MAEFEALFHNVRGATEEGYGTLSQDDRSSHLTSRMWYTCVHFW